MGTPNEVAWFNGVNKMPGRSTQLKWYDVWGTEETYNHMSAGWSWAFDTPFDLVQAERLSGSACDPPEHGGILAGADQGQGRAARAVHARDRRVPTILEVAGIQAPEEVDGIKQAPIEGTSFALHLRQARTPRRRRGTRPSTSR